MKTFDETDVLVGATIIENRVIDNPAKTSEKLKQCFVTLSYDLLGPEEQIESIRIRFLDWKIKDTGIDVFIKSLKHTWYYNLVGRGAIIDG